MRTPFSVWLFLILVHLVHVVSDQCLSDQKSLLLQLKNNLKFSSTRSKKLVQWDETSDCCIWQGVICEEGRVTGLNLSTEFISGGIENSSLFNLQYLKSLDLSYNNFKSKIPPSIGNLANLTVLNFSNAGFEGQIPKEISHLRRLVTLDFSTLLYLAAPSSLKLENPNLRMLVQNLTELEELYLDGANISAPGKEWGQAISSSLPKLRTLSLSNCYVSGPIDHSLMKLHFLSVIRLEKNNLSATFPGFFANFSDLTFLHLGDCGLYGTFPKEIFQLPALRILDISANKLLQGSLPEFPPNSALQSLVITSTNFSGTLPNSIGNLQNLSTLMLANCHFSGILPNSMTKLTQLVYIDLSSNNFTGLIPSLNMSKNLTQIQLSHNSLTGEIPSPHWEGLLKLVNVDLRNNSLNGRIPSSLFALPSLQKIQLPHNNFSGQVHEFSSLCFSILDTLDLGSNHLEGPVPRSIFKLKNLGILSLSSNKFNGTIELGTIMELGNLTALDLSHNYLSVNFGGNESTLPSFPQIRTLNLASCRLRKFPPLKNQSKLVYLDLSDNQIHGEIPNWIWEVGNGNLLHANFSLNLLVGMQEPYSLPNLIVLDLHSNQLRGKIPILPPFASYIDFSSNNFTSSIPHDIGNNLYVATFFSLSNNNFTGVLPDSICDASYLQVLDLSNNRLSGKIPECMSAMALGVLNLNRNNFSGSIPDAFPNYCSLQTLAVNGNSIEGQVPRSLANCTTLEVLDLGNNKLIDHFPCFLKSVFKLRVLVLRSNNFKGNIGCPNISGTWDMLQIVDLASNNFSGKLPGRCLTTWKAMMVDENEFDHLRFELYKLDQSLNYQDAVFITMKGLQFELVKILTVFISIDFSNNNFHGEIPKELGQLKALYVLDLSNNVLSGQIPSSLGNLRHLESLELSKNHLNGAIPTSLANLNFLSFLNLSYNELEGRIPTGNQIQTFSTASFQGNNGLCGPPLMSNCTDDGVIEMSPETPKAKIEWDLIGAEIGFLIGFGSVIGPLVFFRRWRKWYFDHVEDIAFSILPQLLLRKWLIWKTGLQK